MFVRHLMASQGARADPVVGSEESGESAEGLVAPASAGGVDIGREGVGVDAPIPPGGAPATSVKRPYEPREITWAEFQREFDDKYRPKMYRDKKRMQFLNLVQRDDQTVAEYELRFAALAKYAPEAVVTQEDRCYRFE
ncbi:UNVERIFIED_CONTAM: hypothetical protein Slati_4468000 [Sesamum latifolium]|uniref:Retrotransposon gag domain-containing protein n=1 Tax=Sesamum latifolium TaxID=2727402 RepID=A0AAW2SRF9_9LAMI